jgi:hypothetical protein
MLDRLFNPELWKDKWRGTAVANKISSPGASSAPGAEQILRFFGIPVSQVTEARQTQKAKQVWENMKTQVESKNSLLEQQGLHAYPSTAGQNLTIRVRNEESGEVIAEYQNMDEFLQALG